MRASVWSAVVAIAYYPTTAIHLKPPITGGYVFDLWLSITDGYVFDLLLRRTDNWRSYPGRKKSATSLRLLCAPDLAVDRAHTFDGVGHWLGLTRERVGATVEVTSTVLARVWLGLGVVL